MCLPWNSNSIMAKMEDLILGDMFQPNMTGAFANLHLNNVPSNESQSVHNPVPNPNRNDRPFMKANSSEMDEDDETGEKDQHFDQILEEHEEE